jgi:putative molybdopterin biosynthesis protein
MVDDRHIDVLTAQDVARILQVNKNTVYSLAKAGTLRSYTVGRKLRFGLDDVQAYIEASRSARQKSAESARRKPPPVPADDGNAAPEASAGGSAGAIRREIGPATSGAFVIGGRDIVLDVLANYLSAAGVHVLRSYQSGYEELVALYLRRAQAAAIHLWDSSTNAYNLPYVKRLVPGTPVVVLHLASRSQGLLVRKRNPLDLRKWSHLIHKPVVLANREKGAGSRVLLDEHLRLLEADPYAIKGYEREITSDLAQGALIAQGGADVGIGTERVFHQIEGLDYQPLQREQLALVIAKTPATAAVTRAVRGLLRSEMFRRELSALPGYDFTRMGARLYET